MTNSLLVIVITAIKVVLRGKAHAEWKVVVNGERRTVKDEQAFIEDRTVIWGRGTTKDTLHETRQDETTQRALIHCTDTHCVRHSQQRYAQSR